MPPNTSPEVATHGLTESIPAIITTVGPTLLWVSLIFVCVLMFRKPIRAFLVRATGFEAFGAKIFDHTAGQKAGMSLLEGNVNQFRQNDLSVPHTYTLVNAPHSIYFFSHDLMLTYTGLLTGARADIIAFALQSALNHVPRLGLSDSPVHKSLLDVMGKLRKATDPIEEAERGDMALKVWNVSRFVGDVLIARTNQGANTS